MFEQRKQPARRVVLDRSNINKETKIHGQQIFRQGFIIISGVAFGNFEQTVADRVQ